MRIVVAAQTHIGRAALCCLIVLPALLCSGTAFAYARLSDPVTMFEQSSYAMAGSGFEQIAKSILRQPSTDDYDRRVAGLGLVLATMSLANARDPRCYAVWGEVVALYAQLNTTWPAEANRLRDYVAELNIQAAGTTEFIEAPAISLDSNDSALLDIAGTGVFGFEQPPSGIVSQPTDLPLNIVRKTSPEPLFAPRDERQAARLQTSDQPTTLDRYPQPAANSDQRPVGAAISLDDVDLIDFEDSAEVLSNRGLLPVNQFLDDEMKDLGRVAWRFFSTGYQPTTGLVDTHPGYAFTTVWSIASQLAATISAHQIEILNELDFDQRLDLLLATLQQIPLYRSVLPNRNYTTDTAELIGSNGKPSPRGSGWSALEIGRLLVWLKICALYYPDREPQIQAIIERWDLDLTRGERGFLGATVERDTERMFNEGGLGVEQYAAQGYKLWGINTPPVFDYKHTEMTPLGAQELLLDSRENSAHHPLPFLIIATELGTWDDVTSSQLETWFKLHKARYDETGDLVALADFNLPAAPWYGRGTIRDDQGRAWSSQTMNNSRLPFERSMLFTSKSAWLMSSLFEQDAYGQQLFEAASTLVNPRNGFMEGVFMSGKANRTISLNTNALILEALWLRARSGKSFINIARLYPDSNSDEDAAIRPVFVRRF